MGYDRREREENFGLDELVETGDPTRACERLRSGKPLGQPLRDAIALALERASKTLPTRNYPRIAGFRGGAKLHPVDRLGRIVESTLAHSDLQKMQDKAETGALKLRRGEDLVELLAKQRGVTLEKMKSILKGVPNRKKKSSTSS